MWPVCQNLYEMIIFGRKNGDAFQKIFKVYPDLPECRVQDLFSKHTNKDNVWLNRGRAEDLIVSSSGETFPTEKHGRRDRVASIIACGAPGTVKCEERKQKLLDDIWPSVRSANEICPVEQEIQKGSFAIPGPLSRAVKGYLRWKMV